MSSSHPAPGFTPDGPQRRARREKSRSQLGTGEILWLGLLPILVLVPWWTIKSHYQLPTPKIELFDVSGSPQISEHRILSDVYELSDPEKIGFRTVGTREHAAGDAWAVERVKELVQLCDDVKSTASASGQTVDLVCEWDRQQGSGTHKFDIMNRVIYKSYQNLTNILFRISSSHPESKSLAILLNSHLDSTLPSPGAADDAIAVAISLEIARVLIEAAGKGEWEVGWGIIILLNNAEESFQDASHLFSTQHPWAQTVRAVVNLEAAGTKGPELLFQATSEEMVRVYQGVPHPHGTVLANDIFASGIMMSDTDFRQFDQYLSVPGLDMAIVGHSYYYHTSKDRVENIEPGVAQHFAENVHEIVKRMTAREKTADGTYAPSSLLERVQKFEQNTPLPDAAASPSATPMPVGGGSSMPFASEDMGGGQHSRRPDVVFYSLAGTTVIVYSGSTARVMYTVWALICVGLVWAGSPRKASSAGEKGSGSGPANVSHGLLVGRSVLHLLFTLLLAIVYSNLTAFIMRTVLGRQLTWFSGELKPVGLYAWPTLLALFTTPAKRLIPSHVPPQQKELALAHAALLLHVTLAVVVQFLGVGSAVVFFIISLGLGFGVIVGLIADYREGTAGGAHGLRPIVYLAGSILPLHLGVELTIGILDTFVPLTGRMPPFVPAEHIIATPIPVFIFLSLPLIPSLATHIENSGATGSRGGSQYPAVIWSIRIAIMSAVLWYAFLSGWGTWPFDPEHPKRIFLSFTEHVNDDRFSLQMAQMDGAPGFKRLVAGAAQTVANVRRSEASAPLTVVIPEKVAFTQWNTEWNPFFPLGELLEHYTFETLPPLPAPYTPPWRDVNNFGILVRQNVVDEISGTRKIVLDMKHRNVIWTVLAFDAHVLSWSLDTPPPDAHTRHHIKEASFYGEDLWSLEMVVKIASGEQAAGAKEGSGIEISLSGMVESSSWPAKQVEWTAARKASKSKATTSADVAMELFSSVSGWLETETEGSVDVFGMHNVVWSAVI